MPASEQPAPPSARMQPLARLPIFLGLAGRPAVIAGGTAAAAWKAELLSAAGARVEVYAPCPSDELLDIAGEVPSPRLPLTPTLSPQAGRGSPALPFGPIIIHRRTVRTDDLADAALLVGACETDDDAQTLHALAREAGVPINVIDKPQFCDFSFGAIVNRSPLVVGISTDGAAPVFAQAIRAKLEALIPTAFARWAEAARQWRPRIAALGVDARRKLWQRFAARAMAAPGHTPSAADLDALLSGSRRADIGTVVLIDASVDDPESLTLRALRELHAADVIVADRDVAPAILDFARREARKLIVESPMHDASADSPCDRAGVGQADADALTLKLAVAGKRVVRLFAHALAREPTINACRQAGIELVVVPGVDSGINKSTPDHAPTTDAVADPDRKSVARR